MTDISNRKFLQACIAKICQNVGWNFIQATPLELLTDLVRDFIVELGKSANLNALLSGSREPNLDHLARTFDQFGISVSDLKDYVRYVDSSCIGDIPLYPVPSEQYLNHLKPGSREVVTRAFHIHEHLPPMHPHLEDQELSLKHSPLSIDSMTENSSPACSPKAGVFKRPGEPLSESFSSKRSRYLPEEEGRPLRELTSVMMTTSGFLSPAREGKLPEARTPVIKPELLNSDVSNSNSIPENKPEKKKKLKVSSSETNKKNEKDSTHLNEEENELPLKEDEKIGKKSVVTKDSHKPKQLKQLSPKNPSHLATVSPNVKQHKTNVAKNKVSTQNSGVIPNTASKKSPKNDKAVHCVLQKDAQTNIGFGISSNSEYKISSEPDKQKLNILKKISKVKEEIVEESTDKGVNDQVSMSQVDFTIESVIKREMTFGESDDANLTEVKDEVVDIETVQSPNPHSSLLSSNPCSVTSTNVPAPSKPDKRKKKEKLKGKKDTTDKCEQDATVALKSCKNMISDFLKPKVEDAEEEIVPVLVTPSPLPTAPGLIPTIVPSLIPSILEPFTKMEHTITTTSKGPVLPNSFTGHPFLQSESPWMSPTNPPETSTSSINTVEPGKAIDPTLKKKEHKKEKKDKLKKKKKDKIKNKDKSEKKKLKLEKKEKDKTKVKKEKKGKKKDKEVPADNKNDPGNAVPKITLKLTSASPTDTNGSDSSLRMIVIKPVVKKEAETVVKQERPSSPELAKFSPLVPPTKHKPKAHTPEPSKATFSNNVGTPKTPSLPPSVRLDSEGNQVWICPACEKQDDGSPMVGCDDCDAWYHWVCVGIQAPPDTSLWYCSNCLIKQKTTDSEKKKKSKRKGGSKKVKPNTS